MLHTGAYCGIVLVLVRTFNKTKKMKNVKYVTRHGATFSKRLTRQQAIERLAYLDQDERNTRANAPTDSGAVRFNYLAEADAIRAAFNFPAFEEALVL